MSNVLKEVEAATLTNNPEKIRVERRARATVADDTNQLWPSTSPRSVYSSYPRKPVRRSLDSEPEYELVVRNKCKRWHLAGLCWQQVSRIDYCEFSQQPCRAAVSVGFARLTGIRTMSNFSREEPSNKCTIPASTCNLTLSSVIVS